MTEKWLGFVSPGTLYTNKTHAIQYGAQYFYQFDVGHLIYAFPDHYIFSSLLEVDGRYINKNRLFKIVDPNSGGNVIYITPSIWFPHRNLSFRLVFPSL